MRESMQKDIHACLSEIVYFFGKQAKKLVKGKFLEIESVAALLIADTISDACEDIPARWGASHMSATVWGKHAVALL